MDYIRSNILRIENKDEVVFLIPGKPRCQPSPEYSLRKTLVITGSYAVIAATTSYGLVYLLLGEPLASIAPLSFTAVTVVNLAYTRRTGRYEIFRFSNMFLGLFLPSLLTVLLGGFVGTSATIL